MEKLPAGKRAEAFEKETRTDGVKQFVKRISSLHDSTIAHLCLMLLTADLDRTQIHDLVNVICADQGNTADEIAFYTLHRLPHLPVESRDALLAHIVTIGDKTVCNETLLSIPDLGHWEDRLRRALAA
jgi:hypothetical protein